MRKRIDDFHGGSEPNLDDFLKPIPTKSNVEISGKFDRVTTICRGLLGLLTIAFLSLTTILILVVLLKEFTL